MLSGSLSMRLNERMRDKNEVTVEQLKLTGFIMCSLCSTYDLIRLEISTIIVLIKLRAWKCVGEYSEYVLLKNWLQ